MEQLSQQQLQEIDSTSQEDWERKMKEIEKVVYERVPASKAEQRGTWCSAEKQTITRLRNNIRKRLISEWQTEKVEHPNIP